MLWRFNPPFSPQELIQSNSKHAIFRVIFHPFLDIFSKNILIIVCMQTQVSFFEFKFFFLALQICVNKLLVLDSHFLCLGNTLPRETGTFISNCARLVTRENRKRNKMQSKTQGACDWMQTNAREKERKGFRKKNTTFHAYIFVKYFVASSKWLQACLFSHVVAFPHIRNIISGI